MPFFKSASSLRSESSDLDLEGLAESELAKLQRQFRLLESQRHAYTLESRETIRRQMLEVKRLEKENEELLQRQTVAESRTNRQRGKDQADSLRAMLGRRDDVEQQIIQEKKRIALLDREIQSWEKRLAVQKKEVGGGHLIQQQKSHLQKRVQTLENQLDRATSRFNSQLVVNSQLREDLEILQFGHDRFEQLYKHLEKELLETRQNIGAMINSSTTAYDARDEAQNRLSQLRDKTEKDLKQYDSEVKELNCILEHDRRMNEFITIKLQERKLTKEALIAKEKKEQEYKRRGPEEELLESYQDAVENLLQLTGMNSLDAVLDKFVAEEERNFAQFNYVSEQNNQLEQIREQIAELTHEIETVQTQEAQKEAEKLSRLREAEAQQEEVLNEIKRIERLLKSRTKIWEMFKSEIESLFSKLQCDPSVLEKMLGGSTAAQDENIAIYMGLIEQKINDLLAMYSYVIAEQQDKPFDTLETVQLILGQKPERPPHRLSIRPPTSGPSHDLLIEEDQRPLTYAELKEKALKEVLSRPETPFHRRSMQPDVASVRVRASGYKKTPHAS
ncbi:outer dynein arm-docking complex subunit 1 isoform X2 [Eublepharis macularius]|uniref:Outer dynein arm-docking complex subunit 1 isoform X2 n=1 Tax=Eublepharis macularius TaxID=481883 RepID=A0AA97LAZ8_EUBMA|nr:outer dynein arm-docking complex subunit 1 isoform X2 [Eublepharis macularius]